MKKFYQLHNKSLEKNKVKNLSELWEKMKAKGYKGLSVPVNTKFVKSAESDNKYHAIFSTASVDRHGDIVEQNWLLKNFKNNPVYLDSHNYNSIEKIIGRIDKIKAKGVLEGDIIFATVNPLGQLAKDLAEGGFLNTSSVGFIPKKFDDKFERIIESELLEISAVSVPANAEALYEKKYGKSTKDVTPSGEGDAPEPQDGDGSGDELELEQPEGAGEGEGGEGEEEVVEDIEDIEDAPIEQIPEEIADEVINNSIKKTADDLLNEIVKCEVDTRKRALNKIYNATKLICGELKVGDHISLDDKLDNKIIVNKCVKELLAFKKTLK